MLDHLIKISATIPVALNRFNSDDEIYNFVGIERFEPNFINNFHFIKKELQIVLNNSDSFIMNVPFENIDMLLSNIKDIDIKVNINQKNGNLIRSIEFNNCELIKCFSFIENEKDLVTYTFRFNSAVDEFFENRELIKTYSF